MIEKARSVLTNIAGECAGGDDESAGCPTVGHDPKQLADNRNADLGGTPVFALGQDFFSVFSQYQVHATIWSCRCLNDLVALLPESLTHQLLKFRPG